LATLAQW